jgi:hypothetical protein
MGLLDGLFGRAKRAAADSGGASVDGRDARQDEMPIDDAVGQDEVTAACPEPVKTPGGDVATQGQSRLAQLVEDLAADTYVERIQAATALAELGDPAALPALERMSHGTDDLWVLFGEEMRIRARMTYPSGVIPGTDQEMLWNSLRGNNEQLKKAAEAAIGEIKRRAGTLGSSEDALLRAEALQPADLSEVLSAEALTPGDVVRLWTDSLPYTMGVPGWLPGHWWCEVVEVTDERVFLRDLKSGEACERSLGDTVASPYGVHCYRHPDPTELAGA